MNPPLNKQIQLFNRRAHAALVEMRFKRLSGLNHVDQPWVKGSADPLPTWGESEGVALREGLAPRQADVRVFDSEKSRCRKLPLPPIPILLKPTLSHTFPNTC